MRCQVGMWPCPARREAGVTYWLLPERHAQYPCWLATRPCSLPLSFASGHTSCTLTGTPWNGSLRAKAMDIQQHERRRLEFLLSLDVLDTDPEEAFDRIAASAASLCNTP